MTSVSITQLKTSPAKVIAAAADYPVAIQNRNDTQAYIVGKKLFEKLERYAEDYIDKRAIESTDFSKGEDLEQVVKELGL